MKIILLNIALLLHISGYGQKVLYQQRNKILEYSYGVLDSGGVSLMNASEKIKYELKFTEKTYQKKIFNDYSFETEIKVDSNEYEEEWMNLPKRYLINTNGISFFDKKGILIRTIPNTTEQSDELKEEKNEIALKGFHPGLSIFPIFQPSLKSIYQQEGFKYELGNEGELIIERANTKTIFNLAKQTIVEEFIDADGIKNKITSGYEEMENKQGFLLRIEKHERFQTLEKGPCITETRLRYFTGFEIKDEGNLIGKSLQNESQITLYPNPNNGIFNAAINLKSGIHITSIKIINLRNGQVTTLDTVSKNLIEINQANLPAGNYTLQITTSENKIINANFVKN